MHDIEHLPGIFTLGYLGENEFRTIQIDLTSWLKIIPDGIANIVHIRPGETSDDAYIASTTFENGILSWHILAEDLGEQAGYGIMQINLNGHDLDNNQVAKSEVIKTQVNASAMDVSGDIPSAQQNWMDRMLELLAKENMTINDMQSIMDRIISLLDGVEDMPKAYFFECDRLQRTPGITMPRYIYDDNPMGDLVESDSQSFVIKLPDGVQLNENDLIFIKTTTDITVPERESEQYRYTIYGICLDESDGVTDAAYSNYDINNIKLDHPVGFQLFDKDRVYMFQYHIAYNHATHSEIPIFDIINYIPGLHDLVETAKTAWEEASTLVNGKVVRYDIEQSLTNTQKTRVRENIGAAGLDSNGYVLSSQLPSYVDDVLEGYIDPQENPVETFYKNRQSVGDTYAYYGNYIPEESKIYVELATQKAYRWSGSIYVEISPSLALGETNTTAFPGDRGLALEQNSNIVIQTAENIVNLISRAETADANTRETLIKVNDAVIHEPKIQNGNWYVWDFNNAEYIDTHVSATGPQGDPAPIDSIVPAVENWMTENIKEDPTVVIDSSLNVSGAAADAAAVKNAIINLKNDIYSDLDGFVGECNITFTENKEQKNTGINLKAGITYIIKQYGHPNGRINLFISGDTNNNKAITKDNLSVRFTPNQDGNLMSYNLDGTAVEVNIKVFYEDSPAYILKNVPKVYKVGKIANQCDYTSFTQCLLDLKNDDSNKIIYIEAGEYNIYQEYIDANVPIYTGDAPGQEYMNYCVWIPENTHIIGRGIVRLKWMPNPENDPIISAQTRCVSPINTSGSMILENVEIYCKNGRYCIHDDINGNSSYSGAIKKFINVKCYKYTNDIDINGNAYGFTSTIGFGLDRRYNITYENCEFHNETTTGYAFYGHTRGIVDGVSLTELQSSNLQIINCIIDGIRNDCVKLGNSTDNAIQIRTLFSGCWFSGGIALINETAGQKVFRNAFNVSLVRCNETNVTIEDPNNPYPIRIY